MASTNIKFGLVMAAMFVISQTASAESALDIIPTFDSSISGDPNAVAIESAINTAIAFYNDNLTTATAAPINVTIYFNKGNSDSAYTIDQLGYGEYLSALKLANSVDATDTTALAGLPATQSILGQLQLLVNSANGRALGFNTPGMVPIGGNMYDALIDLPTAFTTPGSPGSELEYSLLAVTEQKIDEVLGLRSDEGYAASGPPYDAPAPEDLFRYTTGGVRAWNQSTVCGANDSGPLAYFSLDGKTNLSVFNNCANGGDYGGWYSATGDYPGFGPQVQDAFATPGSTPSLNVNSPEVVALDAVGYNLTNSTSPTPEPGTVALFGAGIAALAFYRRRTARR